MNLIFESNSIQIKLNSAGIKHILITALWPRANGLVESFMKNLGKVLRTAKVEGVNWKIRLTEFLKNYRNSPHVTTGVSPASLLLRNNRLSGLPDVFGNFVPSDLDNLAKVNDVKHQLTQNLEISMRKYVIY